MGGGCSFQFLIYSFLLLLIPPHCCPLLLQTYINQGLEGAAHGLEGNLDTVSMEESDDEQQMETQAHKL